MQNRRPFPTRSLRMVQPGRQGMCYLGLYNYSLSQFYMRWIERGEFKPDTTFHISLTVAEVSQFSVCRISPIAKVFSRGFWLK